MVENILDNFATIQGRLTDRKNCPADSILKARLEIWSLWCNQFSIILTVNHEKFLNKLEEISKAATGNISFLMNETHVFGFIPERMLLKIPFVWVCISNKQRNSSLRDCIEMFSLYKPWITGHRASNGCFPVLPAHVPLDKRLSDT